MSKPAQLEYLKDFDDLPCVDNIEIEFKCDYSFTPGRYFGPPELCYPDEEDFDVYGPDDTEIIRIVTRKYLEASQQAIKNILHYRDNELKEDVINKLREAGQDE